MKRKRNYPARRVTKSMKQSAISGVQGFDLKRGMAELEQRPSSQAIYFPGEHQVDPLLGSDVRTQTPGKSREDGQGSGSTPLASGVVLDMGTPWCSEFRSWLQGCTFIIEHWCFILDLLEQEQFINESYEFHRYEGLKEKHRAFVFTCGELLHDAQKRHERGEPSKLRFLLEKEVPRKMWEVGWQKYLDHLDSTGQHEKMDVYLQEAYNEVYQLRNDVPLLEGHWQECLKGLDMYSRRLHQSRRARTRGPLSATGDPDDGEASMIDFTQNWHKPLSALARTFLEGWSIVGRLVKATVYVRIGCMFCQIDRW